MRTLTSITTVALGLALTACGSSNVAEPDAGTDGGTFNATLSHTFPAVSAGVGEEVLGPCQSWDLKNEETLYVQKIRQVNEGAWHHSNWFFVPEGTYGPEGTWKCSEYEFRELLAALAGGVFFAQSTQALAEDQVFPPGAVLEIPPHSTIVGDIHLVNIGAASVDSALTLELETIPEEDVEIRLTPVSFSYNGLDIQPGVQSRFTMECDIGEAMRRKYPVNTPDYNVYYVLPHYHGFGNYFRLSFVDEQGNEDMIYQITSSVGEPLGGTLNPIRSSNGARYLRLTCGYVNPTDRVWNYGFADGEMCVFLAYIDTGLKAQGLSPTNTNTFMGMQDGIRMYEGGCELASF